MKLSILICTLPERQDLFNRLFDILQPQLTNEVEVVINSDEEMSIGAKRNWLLENATGTYSAFIDDDDTVSTDYIQKILRAIETNPDVVGINGIMTYKGTNPRLFVHSLNDNATKNIYYRTPNHLNPVKTEIAKQVMFPDISWGEDKDYAHRLLLHLNTEVMTHGILYNYLFTKNDKPV